MKYMAIAMGYILKFIYDLVNNYGLTIIILTVVIRALLIPLYGKQQKSMAKMSELQPKINEIQQRYANDKEKMNEKLNEVYAEAGSSPLSGCLPLVIQMPIILGLYTLLRNPLDYLNLEGAEYMIVAVHEGFLWIKDLCQTDPIILPILAGLTTFFSMSGQAQTQDSSQGAMKVMKYFFPVMIFLMGRTFPAGLALYWTVGNLVTWVQNKIFSSKKKKEKLKAEVKEEVIKSRKEARGK